MSELTKDQQVPLGWLLVLGYFAVIGFVVHAIAIAEILITAVNHP
jgi:hypothetical protein